MPGQNFVFKTLLFLAAICLVSFGLTEGLLYRGDVTDSTNTFLQLLLSAKFTYGVCIAIILTGLFFAVGYFRSTEALVKTLDEAVRMTKDTEWDDLSEAFSKLAQPLPRLFNAYSRHVIAGTDAGNVSLAGNQAALRSLRSAEEFFTEDNVYYASVRAPFYQSVPGMLTGLGIFFTFVGLAAGVTLATKGLLSTESGTIEAVGLALLLQSIGDLLNGAGQAFFSSIAGLLCSLLFGAWIHHREHLITERLEALNDALEACAPLITQNELLVGLLNRSITQEQTITDLKTSADGWVTKLIDSLSENSKEQTEQLIESLDELLDAFDDVSDNIKEMGNLQVDKLAKTIDLFEAKLLGAFQNMTQSFQDTAKGVGDVVEGLEQSTQTASRIMTEAYQTSNEAVQQLSAKVEEVNARIATSAEQVSANLKAAEEASTVFSEKVSTSGDAFSQRVTEATEQLSASVTASAESFNGQTQAAAKAIGEELQAGTALLRAGLTEAGTAFGESLVDKAKAFSTGIEKSAETFSSSVEKSAQTFETAVNAGSERFENQMERSSEAFGTQVEASAENFGATMQESTDTLRTGIAEITGEFEKAVVAQQALTEAFRSVSDELDENVRTLNSMLGEATKTVTSLMSQYEALRAATSSLTSEIGKQMTTAAANTQAQNANFANLSSKLDEMIQRSFKVLQQNEQALTLLGQSQKTAVEYLGKAFEQFREAISGNLHNADEAFGKAISVLNSVVSDMNEGHGELKVSVEALRAYADNFAKRADDAHDVAQAFTKSLDDWRNTTTARSNELATNAKALETALNSLKTAVDAQNRRTQG